MRAVAAISVCLIIGCGTVGLSERASAEDLVLAGPDDPELDRFRKLSVLLRAAVAIRDVEELAGLASAEDAQYLRDRLSDTSNPEYKMLFTEPGSPGVMFEAWKNVRWVAARDRALAGHGGGALLCMVGAVGNDVQWPPKASDLRALQRAGRIYCNFTYIVDGRRVLAFNFIYPEESEPSPSTE